MRRNFLSSCLACLSCCLSCSSGIACVFEVILTSTMLSFVDVFRLILHDVCFFHHQDLGHFLIENNHTVRLRGIRDGHVRFSLCFTDELCRLLSPSSRLLFRPRDRSRFFFLVVFFFATTSKKTTFVSLR